MKKKRNWKKLLGNLVAVSFLVPVGFLVFRLIVPDENLPRDQSDYVLMLLQCLLGMVALAMPTIISRKWKLEIPSGIYILYVLFLYCAIFLGEVRSFYYQVPNWDTYLHTFSGAMIGALGFSVIRLLNEEESIHMRLSPVFVAVFSFCFAVALGAVWEIYEFTADGIMGLNMQKFATEEGVELAGRAALLDTMKDLIVDTVGALVISVVGFISLKYKKGWVEQMMFRKLGAVGSEEKSHSEESSCFRKSGGFGKKVCLESQNGEDDRGGNNSDVGESGDTSSGKDGCLWAKDREA